MRKFIVVLFLLVGCATKPTQPTMDAGTYQRLLGEIKAQEKRRKELEAANAELAERVAQTERAPPPAISAIPPGIPPAPGPMLPALPGYADQDVIFLDAPPAGYGGSAMSVEIRNEASDWVVFGQVSEYVCHLEVEIDGHRPVVVRSSRGHGAFPALQHVKERGALRTAALIPPGRRAYVLLDRPGLHSWRWKCFQGPPKLEPTASGGPVQYLPLVSEGQDSAVNRRTLRVTSLRLREVQ